MDTFIDDEKAAEIQKTFSYDGYQTVRRELFAHLREPQMTIRTDRRMTSGRAGRSPAGSSAT